MIVPIPALAPSAKNNERGLDILGRITENNPMPKQDPSALIRPLVQRVQAYVPGEQPKIAGLIKLNTNENPYPPAPAVLKTVRNAVDARFRLYPNPTAQPLRERLAKLHRCKPENIIIGNGSDELLALAVRAFVEPASAYGAGWAQRRALVQYFSPSYSLYPVLASIHGAVPRAIDLNPDFTLPSAYELKQGRAWDYRAPLTFITTPNAPGGTGYSVEMLDQICSNQRGVVVLDEAYANFARENAMALAFKYPHVLVARTFSKAYSLCFQRVGYFVGSSPLIEALDKIRDSYNVNGLGQVAALATLDHLPYYQANFKKIIATREKTTRELRGLGFTVLPSQANFIFARPPHGAAQQWLHELRARKILVRWFDSPATALFLRITIGTEPDMASLVKACKHVLDHGAPGAEGDSAA